MPEISYSALDDVIPFALIVRENGEIVHLGRSLQKALSLRGGTAKSFFDIFTFTAPRMIAGKQDLLAARGRSVTLAAQSDLVEEKLELRATIASANEDHSEFLVLTSLGLNVSEMIEPLGLLDQDFSFPDASVDLLYVLDSRNELMRNAQVLNERIEKAKDLAERQARTDALTGLSNRRALIEYTENLIDRRNDAAFLFHIDLDLFKQINDRLGHAAGDAILKCVSDDLLSFAGPDDIVARTGGDEFVWIKKQPYPLDKIEQLASQLIEKINAPLRFGSQFAEVSASIGMTIIAGGGGKSFDDFLWEADLALYEVKKTGRGKFKAFSGDMMDRESITQQLIRDIEPAVENGDFVPFFQPQIDSRTGRIFGVEVLGRWLHPKFDLIPPRQFLYVAERARLTEKIDRAIFEQALDLFASWKKLGITPPHLSLNLTEKMLTSFGFVETMREQVSKRGLSESEIVFELLETILVDGEGNEIRNAAKELSQAGFSLAIDDFGTGRASLTSLISVPVNIVKIDRAFVAKIHKSEKKQFLTEAIVRLANRLGLKVLAEGVETQQELDRLREIGCDLFQGFYFAKPMSATQFAEQLRDADWMEAIAEERSQPQAVSRAS